MAIEIVDLPINSMVIFHSYVCLPEGMISTRLENMRKYDKYVDFRKVSWFCG